MNNLHEMMPSQFLTDSGIVRIVGSGSALDKNAVLRQEVESIYHQVPVVFGVGADAAAGAALALIKWP